jgi:hypothetical protein
MKNVQVVYRWRYLGIFSYIDEISISLLNELTRIERDVLLLIHTIKPVMTFALFSSFVITTRK